MVKFSIHRGNLGKYVFFSQTRGKLLWSKILQEFKGKIFHLMHFTSREQGLEASKMWW